MRLDWLGLRRRRSDGRRSGPPSGRRIASRREQPQTGRRSASSQFSAFLRSALSDCEYALPPQWTRFLSYRSIGGRGLDRSTLNSTSSDAGIVLFSKGDRSVPLLNGS